MLQTQPINQAHEHKCIELNEELLKPYNAYRQCHLWNKTWKLENKT
jgi:hypothetical protein